ncbi:MAG: hypothetical protein R2690_08615 [Acidimicrobiales bacterium]
MSFDILVSEDFAVPLDAAWLVPVDVSESELLHAAATSANGAIATAAATRRRGWERMGMDLHLVVNDTGPTCVMPYAFPIRRDFLVVAQSPGAPDRRGSASARATGPVRGPGPWVRGPGRIRTSEG